jgi:hypothetical protein
MKNDDYRDVPLTLAVSLTLWMGAVAAATSAGVFARLSQEAFLALAAFATVFAAAVVLVDARVRGWLAARGAMVSGISAFGMALLLVAGGAGLSQGGGIELAAAPWAPILLFGVPVTVAAAIAAIGAAFRPRTARTARAMRMAGD